MLFVLPIGGADMPVVISLLNAFTGLAAAATGFELENNVLIVSGMLVGASGTLLTMKMGQAMNRSITNVLFGAFGQVSEQAAAVAAGAAGGTVRSTSAEDVAVMLAYARKVVFVPGYGLAVAQAQHDVRALADILEEKGVEVSYAIHPVAGRMPGHMNVLLAEANVPYDQLKEMDDANPEFSRTDVVVVVGANDVVNPGRAQQPGQPDLRHADPQRRRRADRRRPQALDEPRLRRHREPALLQPEDGDAVRRREGVDRPARAGRQERLARGGPRAESAVAPFDGQRQTEALAHQGGGDRLLDRARGDDGAVAEQESVRRDRRQLLDVMRRDDRRERCRSRAMRSSEVMSNSRPGRSSPAPASSSTRSAASAINARASITRARSPCERPANGRSAMRLHRDEPQELARGCDAFRRDVLLEQRARPGHAGQDDVDRPQPWEEARRDLQVDDADAMPELRNANAAEPATEQRGRAGTRVHLRRSDAEQRRLARAVRPENGPVLAFANRPGRIANDEAALAVRAATVHRCVLEPDDVVRYGRVAHAEHPN